MLLANGMPVYVVVLAVIWIISFVVAITIGIFASKSKNKHVKVLKGILLGLACWVGFSIILGMLIPIDGMGAIAGMIGNMLMAYVFWNSPTQEEYIKKLQLKIQANQDKSNN